MPTKGYRTASERETQMRATEARVTADRAVVAKIAAQIGSTLLDDSDRWMNRFEIKSRSSGRSYVIAQQRADAVWGCSCPGWTHHRKCKHLTDVLGRLAAVADQYNHLEMMVSARTAFLILDEPTATKKIKAAPGRVLDID